MQASREQLTHQIPIGTATGETKDNQAITGYKNISKALF
jgi:hypothetical protein